MRGTWDDVNRRLTGALLALDLHDALVVGDRVEPVRQPLLDRFLGRRPPPDPPRRFVQVTAAQTVLIAECVGSTSFGGAWAMDEATEQTLLRQGWARPWSPTDRTFWREAPIAGAPRLALAAVRALELLGCTVEGLDVALVREEPD